MSSSERRKRQRREILEGLLIELGPLAFSLYAIDLLAEGDAQYIEDWPALLDVWRVKRRLDVAKVIPEELLTYAPRRRLSKYTPP